jgi:FkbM family methyltransferase
MGLRSVVEFVWNNPGNRHQRFSRLFLAVCWQIRKRLIPRPLAITLVNGVRFWAHPDCTISSALNYADWPEYEELHFCRANLRQGDAVLDIGANVGHFSLLIADIVGPEAIYCFEPTPLTWRRLKENFALNGWPTDHLFHAAVGKCAGSVEFPDSNKPCTTNSLVASQSNANTARVPLVTLDSFITRFDGQSLGLLKIDVEGYETEVFEGARNLLETLRPRLILFESLSGQLNPRIGQILRERSYKVFKLGPQGKPQEAPLDAQNLFAVPTEIPLKSPADSPLD